MFMLCRRSIGIWQSQLPLLPGSVRFMSAFSGDRPTLAATIRWLNRSRPSIWSTMVRRPSGISTSAQCSGTGRRIAKVSMCECLLATAAYRRLCGVRVVVTAIPQGHGSARALRACIDETMCTGARLPCTSWRLASPRLHAIWYSLLRPGAREAADRGRRWWWCDGVLARGKVFAAVDFCSFRDADV